MPSSGVAGFAVPPETRVEAVAAPARLEVFESRLCSASLLSFSSASAISASSNRFLAESVSFFSAPSGFSAGGSVEKSEVASIPDAVVAVVGSGGGTDLFLLTGGASAVAEGGGGGGSAAGVSAGGRFEDEAAAGSSGGRPLVGLLRGLSGLIAMYSLRVEGSFSAYQTMIRGGLRHTIKAGFCQYEPLRFLALEWLAPSLPNRYPGNPWEYRNMAKPKPVVLMVLDGFGIAPDADGNAVTHAQMPRFQHAIQTYPAMTVLASGSAVGLSWGEMGNSEVGHLTIGAGRIFFQSLPRITFSIENGEFYQNKAFLEAVAHAQKTGGAVHLMGLVSPGNVHASDAHCVALLELCKRQKFDRVFVHAFLDGRDAIYNRGIGFIGDLEAKMKELKTGKLATIAGRYWAMDRDNRWDRIQKAYDAMVLGVAEITASSGVDAIQHFYDQKIYDEQIPPTVITKSGKPIAQIKAGDSVIFFNFRPDRAREIAKAFVLPHFEKFPREYLSDVFFVTFTEYEKDLPVTVAYPPQLLTNCLAKVVSDAGLKQLHIAETEKYAHVTFFMNGMVEEEFPGEDRVIIPSPRVSTYDKAPEMSAMQIAERVVQEIAKASYDLIILNFANPDMVGHTGDEAATVKANETVDQAMGMIIDAALAVDGVCLVTADHGNAEEVKNLMTGDMDKEHSTNPVPLLIIGKRFEGVRAPSGDVSGGDLSLTTPVGMLADVAPTILKLLEVPQPPEMTGRALI